MLTLPFLVGAIRSSGSWAQIPLFVFWISGYLAFFAAGTWLRSRRQTRYVRPVQVYVLVAAVMGLVVVAVRPALTAWIPAFAPLAAVSLFYSSRRADRSVANDFVTILAACLFGLVTYQAGDSFSGWGTDAGRQMLAFFVVLVAYFFGTVLYVKTLLRERNSRGFRHASIVYHAVWALMWAGCAVVSGDGWWWLVAAVFVALTIRAAILAGRAVRPMHVGLGEIGACVVLLAVCAAWPQQPSSSAAAGAPPAALAYPDR